MSYKILTKNGIDNSNIDGARGEYFNSGMRDGIVQGALNEGLFTATASNIISLDTCELRIAGHRIVIDEPVYHTFTNAPSSDTRYAFIAQVVIDDNQNVDFSLFVQTASTPLIQNDLYKNITGVGTYQVEIGRFTLLTSLTIEDVVRTIDVITGGTGKGNGSTINIGNVITQTLDPGVDAEVDVDSRYEEDEGKEYLDFKFGIPGGKSGTVAELVPSGTDINTYRGSAYWGKTFYAGGNNTIQNLPYSHGAGFFLEVMRAGTYSTVQRLSAITSLGNEYPTVYTRSVTDTATAANGAWSEWQEVAEANGIYPEMEVGEAERLSMRANVSGAGQMGWYKVGTVTVEGLKAIQNTNASYSLFMLVNGANPPGTNNSAAHSGIVEIDTAVGSGGQLQLENGYTAIKALCGNIDVNDFAVGIDSAGTTLTVYMDARENGVGTRTAFSIISEIYGAMSGSAFEFGWEFYGAAAPADAVYVTLEIATKDDISSLENQIGDISTILSSVVTVTEV